MSPRRIQGYGSLEATLNVFSLPVAVVKEKVMEEHQLRDRNRREEPLPFGVAQQGEVTPQGPTGKGRAFSLRSLYKEDGDCLPAEVPLPLALWTCIPSRS